MIIDQYFWNDQDQDKRSMYLKRSGVLYNSACNESDAWTAEAHGQEHQHPVDVLELGGHELARDLVVVGLPHLRVRVAHLGVRDILPARIASSATLIVVKTIAC